MPLGLTESCAHGVLEAIPTKALVSMVVPVVSIPEAKIMFPIDSWPDAVAEGADIAEPIMMLFDPVVMLLPAA
jgi:hypothetical protein